ncbi:hypothetical protein Hypma_009337 [Hypsizygus marmoreus]|uniref:Uncharacterized protein n=1 Tax=Hypsizygus marmoreus TaxID=39966 RepID=A0A369JPQ4_HYPMA|nr:hypothetical protein Hypma_009337 [Hypsizygus marmoreus]
MANLMHPAKSASHWMENELRAFNIRVVSVDTAAFFGNPTLPPAPVSPTILSNLQLPDGAVENEDRLFFEYLEDALSEGSNGAVVDFSTFLLRMMKYDHNNRRICTKKMSFNMAGQYVDAIADVCELDNFQYLLLVQVHKAIAAFYQNNLRRNMAGLPLLSQHVIAGITMVGTAPVFYRIPITMSLLDAVATGSYPQEETVVMRFVPPVQNTQVYMSKGMRTLEGRRVALQCLEAFKSAL